MRHHIPKAASQDIITRPQWPCHGPQCWVTMFSEGNPKNPHAERQFNPSPRFPILIRTKTLVESFVELGEIKDVMFPQTIGIMDSSGVE